MVSVILWVLHSLVLFQPRRTHMYGYTAHTTPGSTCTEMKARPRAQSHGGSQVAPWLLLAAFEEQEGTVHQEGSMRPQASLPTTTTRHPGSENLGLLPSQAEHAVPARKATPVSSSAMKLIQPRARDQANAGLPGPGGPSPPGDTAPQGRQPLNRPSRW